MFPTNVDSGDFEERCSRLLATRRERAMQLLRTLIKQDVPSEVTGAEMEIFFQDDGGAPDVWIYFDGKNKKVSKSDQSIYPGRAMQLDFGLDVLSDLETHETNAAANVVKAWLAECWFAIEAENYLVPLTLSVHDGWGDGKQVALVPRK